MLLVSSLHSTISGTTTPIPRILYRTSRRDACRTRGCPDEFHRPHAPRRQRRRPRPDRLRPRGRPRLRRRGLARAGVQLHPLGRRPRRADARRPLQRPGPVPGRPADAERHPGAVPVPQPHPRRAVHLGRQDVPAPPQRPRPDERRPRLRLPRPLARRRFRGGRRVGVGDGRVPLLRRCAGEPRRCGPPTTRCG